MNTKSLLLIAALATAGASSAFGQVTSQNIVGYIRLSLNSGFNLVSNQLSSGDNRVATVLTVPDGTDVYTYNGTSFAITSYAEGEWSNPAITLTPGAGFYVRVGAPTTVVLVGEVRLQNSISLVQGFNLIACPIPLSGSLTDTASIGFTAQDGDDVYKFNNGSFSINSFAEGEWSAGAAPQISVGEGFWVRGAARTYTRNFSVN
jgi:hypothetical protein